MKAGERWILASLLLLGLCALSLALALLPGAPRLSGESELCASLERLNEPVTIQWYASPAGEFHGERRAIPLAIERLESVSGIRVQRIDPGSDAAQAAHAARLGLAPLRLRTIERDGWSEINLWSSLRIVSPTHGAWTLARLGPLEAPQLAALVAGGLDQLRAPRRPRVGLRLPAQGYGKLEAELAQRAELFLLGDAPLESIPAEIDWLIWIVAERDGARQSAALEHFLARGGELLLCASGAPAPTAADELLFSVAGAQILGDASRSAARSIAQAQDFQPFGAQPNGTLFFGPCAQLQPLDDPAWRMHTLASDEQRLARLMLAEPAAGEGGRAVLSASPLPLSDAHWSDETLAHRALVRVLEARGADPARADAARLAARPAPPLPELSSRARFWMRALVVFLIPLGLGLLALARLRAPRSANEARRSPLAWRRTLALALSLGLLAMLALPEADPRLPAALTTRVETLAQRGPVQWRWSVSERERLPVAWRGPLADFERDLVELAAGALRIERYPALDAEQRRILQQQAVPSVWVREADENSQRAQEFVATLTLTQGARSETLHFHRESELIGMRFRLAFALERLLLQAPVRIAFHSPSLRLSPAEAQLQYQDRGLFAPGGGDPCLAARELLRAQGFMVLPLSDAEFAQDPEAEMLLLLQPQRPSQAAQAAFARALERGIPALVAAQHFVAMSRARGEDPRASGWWPQPQFLDLEQGFFQSLGLEWQRTLLFDEQCASAEVTTVNTAVNTAAGPGSRRSTERALLSNPWFPRLTGAGLAQSGLESVGAMSMPQASPLRLDEARCVQSGWRPEVLLRSSERSWTHEWSGGELNPAWLQRPSDGPAGEQVLGWRFTPREGGSRAGFIALGAWRQWSDEELHRPQTDNANALVELCARATLPKDLCALLSERASAPGLVHVPPAERVRWRWLTLAAPLAVLGAALFLWRRWRA